ncbi:MAG TPA: family 10 glycosylhydrolase [Phycisphaerae bacterium]|nr:family 10 glycosylhydrolase [Phycisphaerae bacterium]
MCTIGKTWRNAVAFILACGYLTGPAWAQQVQWRGLWADCFHTGFKSVAQIDTLIQHAVTGKYNAIVVEVMGYQDRTGSGHGAYWNSNILPKATDIVGGIDPLAYLCQRAAEHGIQVHAWLVTFRVCRSWPPSGNAYLAAHPEFFMVPRAAMHMGTPVLVGADYVLDPGSPDVQEYLISIVRELVTNYPIDGINWDYIRYTQYDAGYPVDPNYANSGLKRFQRIYNRTDVPSPSDSQWSDFRRRTIDELVRRCRVEIANLSNDPAKPVMLTADVFATGSAPSNFTSSQAYLYYQNWKLWAESGWLDAVIPMNYKRDHCPSQYNMYRSWVDKIQLWKGPRHAYCGQATYLNSFANSLAQMQYTLARLEGVCTYSYAGTRANDTTCDDGDDSWTSDWSWYPHVGSTVYATPAVPPSLPWRNPATATEGTVWGRVFDFATGQPIDDATVTVYGRPAIKTDANGYYTVTLVPAVAAGSAYAMTVSKAGYPTLTYPGAKVFPAGLSRYDFALGAPAPQIVLNTNSITRTISVGQPPPNDAFTIATAPGTGYLNYSITHQTPWLSVSPERGTSYGEANSVTVAYDLTGLTSGIHTGIITVSDPTAANSPQTITVTIKLSKPCDFDFDGDVDLEDFAVMQTCLTGVGVPFTDPDCARANLDGDTDVDGTDVQKFIGCMSGPGKESSVDCLN